MAKQVDNGLIIIVFQTKKGFWIIYMNKFYESNKTWNSLNRFERYRVLVLYAFGFGDRFQWCGT